jgi:hypothetical protein
MSVQDIPLCAENLNLTQLVAVPLLWLESTDDRSYTSMVPWSYAEARIYFLVEDHLAEFREAGRPLAVVPALSDRSLKTTVEH